MAQNLSTRCCIAGGGPAGMMLGLLLARAGVEVIVLEKHADFLRDFRGDTVHPSTLQVMHELGLLQSFLARPHDEVSELRAVIGSSEITLASFRHVPARCRFIAMMPQWEFLDFLHSHASSYPGYRLIRQAEVTGILSDGDTVTGVRAMTPEGEIEISAGLVVGADGRHSAVRTAAGLVVRDLGAPIDVLWMRLPKLPGDASTTGARISPSAFLVTIDRRSYWQCALVIPKGGNEAIRARGLDAFRASVVAAAPMFAGRVQALESWDDIKLLSVTVDRLERWWRPGLICIGDAAHAMSPIGGVGINLAVQDAVAAANMLAGALADPQMGAAGVAPLLAQIQKRRLLPARWTQAAQVAVQNRLLSPLVGRAREVDFAAPMTVPWPLRLLNRWPILQALPAYAVGVGIRPEHVRSPVRQGPH
jgi:2-polyprenyl-6-methoxyphenol hydroxylase-like FAD-dependent oxidoreductase